MGRELICLLRLFVLAASVSFSWAQFVAPAVTTNAIGSVDLQTGYFPQKITLVNGGTVPYAGVRVFVWDIPKDSDTNLVRVANAHGYTNNNTLPYFDFGPVAATGSVTFTVEFYVSNRRTMPPARYEAVEFVRGATAVQIAFVVAPNATYVANGRFYAIFTTERDRFYYVQYSSNFVNWVTSLPALRGTGAGVIWEDSGPPRTESLPLTQGSRFYRAVAVP